ncbi:MAG: hypothetical protein J2P18_00860 [Nocardia sp.]|nr:hypothetical protein [Nocardia sp.]
MRIAVAGGTGVVGRYVVECARAAGHDVIVLSRSTGVDTVAGRGLRSALRGVDTIVDATNAGTTEQTPATEFFTASVANLTRAGAESGAGHLVVLSIVGIDSPVIGYYAAKLAHEQRALAGPLPVTILRATQFHEFAAQMIAWNRDGALARIPDWNVQPAAARTVGRVLAELAASPPGGWVPDLGGPGQARLATLAARLSDHLGLGIEVQALESEIPSGALIPAAGARLEGPSFEQWLSSTDAAHLEMLS